MLINPYRDKLPTIPGTRMLEDALGLSGVNIFDPDQRERIWTIQWMLAPVEGRALGGLRARLVDAKGFVTFCCQRDLEVLLGYGTPGKCCRWTGQDYPEPGDREWYGLCCDEEDLIDDLFERELRIREQYAAYSYLPTGLEVRRRIHFDHGSDHEELLTLLWDANPETGEYPDPNLQRVRRRWSRIELTRMKWEYADGLG